MVAVRVHRTLFAWFALLALLSNVIAGLLCPLPFKQQAYDDPDTLLLGPLVICSQSGTKTLSTHQEEKSDSRTKLCAICVGVASLGHGIAPAATVLEIPVALELAIGFAAATVVTAAPLRIGFSSRAPPLQA